MHQFIHTLRFLSEGDSPEGPAKECDDFCKDSALIIFGEMVNPCSCSVKIRSSWLYYFNAPYFQGFVPLGESGSGLLICGVPFKQIHFQISDLSNPLWTRIHRITDLRDLRTDHWITDPTRSLGRRIRNLSFCPAVLTFKRVGTSYIDRKDCWQSLHKLCDKHKIKSIL